MNKLFTLFLMLVASKSFAANITDDTLKIGKPGSSTNKKLKLGNTGQIQYNVGTSKLQFSHDGTNFKNVGSGGGGGAGGINLLTDNPDAEAGSANWTASGGTFTVNSTAANVYNGVQSFIFTPSAGGQTVTSDAYASTAAMDGNNGCSAVIYYRTTEATNKYLAKVLTGSTELGLITLDASSTYIPVAVPFPCQTTGTTVKVRVEAAASTPSAPIYWDDAFLGIGFGQMQVSQAAFAGAVTWPSATNCLWSSTSNASFSSWSADSDCTLPAGGNIEGNAAAPATKIPAIKLTNVIPGVKYRLSATGSFSTGTNTQGCSFRFTDGTTSTGGSVISYQSTAVSGGSHLEGDMTFPTGGDHTVEIQGTGAYGNTLCQLGNTSAVEVLRISAYRFPTGSETAVRADSSSLSWSGYHADDCQWARANSAYGDTSSDATCTLTQVTNKNFGTVTGALSGSDKLPGIVFTPSRAASYFVCAITPTYNLTADTTAIQLTDGTTIIAAMSKYFSNTSSVQVPVPLCGIYNATSTSPVTLKIQAKAATGTIQIGANAYAGSHAIDWTIFAVDGGSANMQIFRGMVSTNSSSQYRLESAAVTTTCSGSPCTISRQSGSWMTSITRSGTGAYTANYGGFSTAPDCWVQTTSANSAPLSSVPNTTTFTFNTNNTGGSATDANFVVFCYGPR